MKKMAILDKNQSSFAENLSRLPHILIMIVVHSGDHQDILYQFSENSDLMICQKSIFRFEGIFPDFGQNQA